MTGTYTHVPKNSLGPNRAQQNVYGNQANVYGALGQKPNKRG